jgi:hypothetical protein
MFMEGDTPLKVSITIPASPANCQFIFMLPRQAGNSVCLDCQHSPLSPLQHIISGFMMMESQRKGKIWAVGMPKNM